MDVTQKRTRGHLPHWQADHAIYAVTFRLADSLPQSVLEAYLSERDSILEMVESQKRPLTDHEKNRLAYLFSERIDRALDQGSGACHLRMPAIGQLVFDALQFFDPDRYEIHACCVMPNHVHALFQPRPGFDLDHILHSWKSFTALKANHILKTTGTFWMREYYDHIIRNEEDYRSALQYIRNNPRNAGLQNWPWVTPPS